MFSKCPLVHSSRRFSSQKGPLLLRNLFTAFLIWLIGGWPTLVFALPQGEQVVSGDATFTRPDDSTFNVNQTSEQLIATFNSFNIGQNETVNVDQPSSNAMALFRILGTDPSLIEGNLNANGQVFISNGSGVFFSGGSKVDTYGLVATTMNISNQDFLDENYNFTQNGSLASVINEGTISATSYVGLLAPAVENRGTIVASLGSVDLVAGKAATLDFTGDGLINFEITEAVSGTVLDKDGKVLLDRVSNSGLIKADGGQVRMTAQDAGDVIRNVVNMTGVIEANTVVEKEGRIFLSGGEKGIVSVSGELSASGDDAGEQGGEVNVLGEFVGLFDNALVDVSGDAGGGTALIGGDFQGKNAEVQNAFRTYVGEDAVIDASAKTSGDGGKVIVWADDVTRFYGTALATAGSFAGAGGFIEISGKNSLVYRGGVDASSIYGAKGTVLFDPKNIIVANGGSSLITTNLFGESSSADVTFDADQITAITDTGTSIVLQANNDITINEDILTNEGGSGGNITLQAGRSVLINANITTDNGNLIIVANETVALGVIDGDRDAGAAEITFAAGATVNGGDDGIVSISLRAGADKTNSTSGDITLGAITNISGSVTVINNGTTSGSDILQNGALSVTSTGTLTFTATGDGAITLTNSSNVFTDEITLSSGTGAVQLTDTTLTTIAASTLGGALTVISNAGVTISGNVTTAGTTTFDTDADNNGTGDFTINSSITLSSTSNDVTVTANDAVLTGSIGAGSATVTILVSDGGTILVGTGSLDMTITGAELQNISAGNVSIGDSTAGAITVNGITLANTANISSTLILTAGGVIAFSSGASSITNNLAVSAGGVISQTVGLSVGGTSSFTVTGSNTITLTVASNDFGGAVTLSSGTGAVQLTDNSDSILAASILGGGLTVISSGDITQTGALSVTGASDFTVNGSNIATLTNGSNVFTGAITLSSGTGAVQIADSTASILAASTLGGNLTISSGGAITQTGTLSVTGTSNLTVTGTSVVTLADTSNAFSGALTLSSGTGQVTMFNNTSTVFAASTLGGNLIFNSTGGTITQTGALSVAGVSNFLVASFNAMTLTDTSNVFTGVITLTSGTGAVQLTDSTDTILATGNIGGSLAVISNGDITQSTSLTVAGTSSFTVTGANIVTLTSTSNDFTGNISLTSGTGAVQLTDSTLTKIAASTLGGALTVTSNAGVSVLGNLTTAGTTIFDTDADDNGSGDFNVSASVAVDTTNNALTITANDVILGTGSTVSAGTNNVTILVSDSANIALGDDAVGGLKVDDQELARFTANNLTIGNSSATGDITADGVNLGGSITTLNLVTNSGAVIIEGSGMDTNSTNLTITTASGNISQSAALSVGGTSSFVVSGSATITLTETGNDFTGAVSLVSGSGAVQITDTNALTLGVSSLGGSVTLNANNGITVNSTFTSTGSSTFDADLDNNGTGTLAIDASGALSVSGSNSITVTVADFEITSGGTINTGASGQFFLFSSTSTTTGFGASNCGSSCGMTISGTEFQAITGTDLAFQPTGAIFIENLTATNTANSTGTVQFNSLISGDITVSGSTLTFNTAGTGSNGINLNAAGTLNLNTGVTVTSGSLILRGNTKVSIASGLTFTAGDSIDLQKLGGSGDIEAAGSATFNAGNGITVDENFTSLSTGTITFNADSDGNGVGIFTVTSGKNINSNNNTLSITSQDLELDGTTSLNAGSGVLNLNFTTSLLIENESGINTTFVASDLNVNVTGDLIIQGITSSEISGVTGLITLTSTGNITFQTTALNVSNALTINANGDINVKVDVTSGGTFNAVADNDKNDAGDFTSDSGTTITSTTGDIKITAVNNFINGELVAPQGTITVTSTFVDEFVNPLDPRATPFDPPSDNPGDPSTGPGC